MTEAPAKIYVCRSEAEHMTVSDDVAYIRADIAQELARLLDEAINDEFDNTDEYAAWEAEARDAIQRAKEAGL